MDFVAVANQFTTFYYTTFDNDRSQLQPLYRDNSMMTFETNQVEGAAKIIEKLVNLPFAKVQHKASTIDAQPAGPDGSIIVLVTGLLLIDGGEHPQTYSQTFHLMPEGGTYFVLNDIFRLIYA